MTTTVLPAFDRPKYDRVAAAGNPVASWDDFVSAATELVEADADFGAAVAEVAATIDRLVPSEERQYPAWEAYAPNPVPSLCALLQSDRHPNRVHPNDFDYMLAFGRSARNPVSRMNSKASRLRSAARRMRRELANLSRV